MTHPEVGRIRAIAGTSRGFDSDERRYLPLAITVCRDGQDLEEVLSRRESLNVALPAEGPDGFGIPVLAAMLRRS
jgi:hypothetical protein